MLRSAAPLDRLLWVAVNLCLTPKILFIVANKKTCIAWGLVANYHGRKAIIGNDLLNNYSGRCLRCFVADNLINYHITKVTNNCQNMGVTLSCFPT